MALYGGMRITAITTSSAGGAFGTRVTEGKQMLIGEFTPTSITTTINTGSSKIDAVIMAFVSAPTSAHSFNHYTASTNGTVRVTHMTAVVSGASAIDYVTATAGWSRLSYMIVGSEQPPAAS